MESDAGEKKHKATGKRLGDLRKKGSVLRSKDLSGGLTLLISMLLVIFFSSSFEVLLKKNLLLSTNGIKDILVSHELGMVSFKIVSSSIIFLIPVFSMSFISAWLGPFIFGGWNFTLEALHFKTDNLSVSNNLKKIFSIKRAATEIFKSAFKSFLIIGALIYFMLTQKDAILSLIKYPILKAIQLSGEILTNFIMLLGAVVILMVSIDMAIQYFQFHSENKMSTQELKDEGKETEGNADVKRKIRSRQMAMIKQRLHAMVPQANVIITNPTHYAVALRYDETKDRAPKVLAKGKGPIAQQIRFLAISHSIPIYEEPLLARAIFHTTKNGSEVKPELYMAVAIVLSYIHQLRNYQQGKGQLPKVATDLKIPAEFIFDK